MRAKLLAVAVWQGLVLILPWAIRRRALNLVPGFRICRSARIGLSLIFADEIILAEGANIGHFTLIRGLVSLKLGPHSNIGHLNAISGLNDPNSIFFREEADRVSLLDVAEHAAITNRHHIDCTNAVRIGEFTTFAGAHSQILTHSQDLRESRQRSAPVTIGPYCFVGTGVILLYGSSLAGHCVLGAGSVLRTADVEEYCLWSGVPARKIKKLDESWKYFHRDQGFVV